MEHPAGNPLGSTRIKIDSDSEQVYSRAFQESGLPLLG